LCLHEPTFSAADQPGDPVYASTMVIPGGLEMTTSKDVLEAISTGAGPRRVLVTLGYSAWGAGQLESELSDNAWLTVAASPSVIFDTPVAQRYDQRLAAARAGSLDAVARRGSRMSQATALAEAPAVPAALANLFGRGLWRQAHRAWRWATGS